MRATLNRIRLRSLPNKRLMSLSDVVLPEPLRPRRMRVSPANREFSPDSTSGRSEGDKRRCIKRSRDLAIKPPVNFAGLPGVGLTPVTIGYEN